MDILDVWFESGASSHAVLDFDPDTLQKPGDPDPRADLYAEGGDQHRGWFMSSLLCSIGMHNRAPFKEVATYGWTLDEKGRALSKSLGNFIDPVAIMDQLGGDIVRLWVASVDFREDVVASLPLLKRLAEEIYRKLRNTFRFLLGSLRETRPSLVTRRLLGSKWTIEADEIPYEFDPIIDSVPFEQMQPIDQYILARTAELTGKITRAYADFEFHRVYHLLNEFCNSELSAFYLDVLKDRLYTYPVQFKPGHAEQERLYVARRSAQTAIYKITDALARLTAPILSFTADEVYQSLPGTSGSVHLQLFPRPSDLVNLSGEELNTMLTEWGYLAQARSGALNQLEAMRARKEIGKALEAELHLHYAPATANSSTRVLVKYQDSLAEILGVSTATISAVESLPEGIAQFAEGHPQKSEHEKCDRCWRHVPDVGHNANYPTVCLRCAEALDAIDFPPYPAPES